MNLFKRGQDPKEALSIGLENRILKYLKQSSDGYRANKWSLSDQPHAFYAFVRIATDADHYKEGPIEEYIKMLLFILDKYPYSKLAKGKMKKPGSNEFVVEQKDINNAGARILNLFITYQDVPEVQELFRRTVKTIRLSNLSTGQKTKLLKFFRDEYVKNLPDEV